MDKERILKESKLQMLRIIDDELNLETIDETFEELGRYQQLLNSLKAVNVLNEQMETDSVEEVCEEKDENAMEEKSDSEKGYVFTRQLKGGYIEDLSIFVPESAVRAINAEEGDKLHVESKENSGYHFEVIEKGTNDSDREEIKYAIVEKQDGMLIARRTIRNGGENIKVDDMLYSFLISNEDKNYLNLQEGDIVDIAYYKKIPKNSRVVWKHETESPCHQTPQKSSVYKSKENNESSTETPSNLLKNKKVLVIGCEPRKQIYKETIEETGGEFEWAEGIEQEERLQSMIKRADVVVLLITFMRHRASQLAIKLCKEYNVSFSIVDSLGVQSVLNSAIHPTSVIHTA